MIVTVLLGGHLRTEAKDGPQQRPVELAEGATVCDLCLAVGLNEERVKMVLVNGRGSPAETVLNHGDRIGLFPPELAYNTFVAVSFRKETVEGRQRKLHEADDQGNPAEHR